jgi:hypothetical protein
VGIWGRDGDGDGVGDEGMRDTTSILLISKSKQG